MSSILSKEFFVEKFRSKSLILGSDQGQGKTSNPIYGISEAKALLREILDKRIDGARGHLGFLESAKAKAREARKVWDNHNSAQPSHARKNKPHDIFLEKINKAKARVQVIEMEARALNTLIADHEGKQENEQEAINKKLQKKKSLTGKLKGGILVKMGGRVVKNGTTFEDNGESVADYIAKVKKERAEFSKVRRAKQKEQAEAAEEFRQKTGLTGKAA